MCPSAAQSGPIDGFCRPASSPQATAAGCTRRDGAALTDASTACEMCSGGFFLFRGGCYSTKSASGSEICTAAEGGKCTTCNTKDNYIFQNRAATVTLGNECILCSDAKGADGVTGVANCNKCTAPGSAGPATCSACQEGYFLSGQTCTKCADTCATCTAANTCTSCGGSKYLLGTSCVDSSGCGNGKYADPQSNKYLECGITDCATCAYDAALQGPKCLTCTSPKIVKEETNGATTCSEIAACTQYANTGPNFLTNGNTRCALCSNVTDSTTGNQGIAHCITCQKASASTAPTCSACGNGHFLEGSACTATCGTGCATCSAKDDPNKCSTCMAGFFLVTEDANKKCVSCGDTAKGGIDGCAECLGTVGSLKCTKCKPNRKPVGTEGTQVTCEEKTCEDPTACGGTAGACEAIVIGASGEMTYYCSLCGDSTKIPIDGKCVDSNQKQQNTCENGVCTQCTNGYFLYMGGCYKLGQVPGSYMCTDQTGSCTTPTSHYFLVPGATAGQQSVLACENPVGTAVGERAYIGVEGCKTCTAPSEAPSGAMASARCTACDGSKKPSLLGSGCFTCAMDGCSHCSADGVCEACTSAEQRPNTDGKQCILCNIGGCTRCSEENQCSQCGDGYRLESNTCVSTGANLSTGAIAGISVAAVVVVGGLVGFLCWWFLCRGKA
ncbi:Variant-specific surface protein [Giardia duodenalis]|uniref:Variant-specific surface protein n=1 Tax=Giardia intestinalis TaxID=5741 RepID=V6TPF0_GIAIN|nr:Variant-specific surface protein [Giardia intestinalis]